MPIVSSSGDHMDYGFPAPPQGDGIFTDRPPVDIHSNLFRNDPTEIDDRPQYFTRQPHSARLTTEEQIEDAFLRLSTMKEAESDTTDSLSSASSASTTGDWSTPPTPITPPFLVHQPPTTLPFDNPIPSTLPHDSQRSTQAQSRTTTNRKLAMVRAGYRTSGLRTEVRYDSSPQFDHAAESSARESTTHNGSVLNSEDHRSPSEPCGSRSNYRYEPAGIHTHPAMSAPYHPNLAVQACIRTRRRSDRSIRAAEEEYRFPPGLALKKEGIPCSSTPCTAPHSLYNTPIDTPFATPPDSPVILARPSLWDIKIGTDSDADSLTTHAGGTRPTGARNARSRSRLGSVHNMSNVRMVFSFWNRANAKKLAKETRAWEKRANDALFPPRPYSIASDGTETGSQKHCALIRTLKKILWRLKIRAKNTETLPPTT